MPPRAALPFREARASPRREHSRTRVLSPSQRAALSRWARADRTFRIAARLRSMASSPSPLLTIRKKWMPQPPAVKISKGTLFGNGGTIVAGVSCAGTLTPASSATTVGKLTIRGAYTQTAVGALDANISGAESGEFNLLNVTEHRHSGRNPEHHPAQQFCASDWRLPSKF